MRTPADLSAWAGQKYRAGYRTWAASVALGADETLSYPLHPPTAGRALAGLDQVAEWVTGWARWAAPGSARVVWAERTWPGLGRQRLPLRVTVEGAATVAALAGRQEHWRRLVGRAVAIRNRWPAAPALDAALASGAARLAALDDDDAARLLEVVEWLCGHPASGLHVRELPVPGITTKWAERHQELCRTLKAGVTGDADLGLTRQSTRYRVRVLDPRLRPFGLADFSAPAAELARVPLAPAVVLIAENLTTVAAMPRIDGVVAVHGYGQAVTGLAEVGWLTRGRVLYWGDLDTWGFRILSTLRQRLPHVESVLMDDDAITRGLELSVDPADAYAGVVTHLTDSEIAALARLRLESLKIEQERIDWDYALAAIRARVGDLPGQG